MLWLSYHFQFRGNRRVRFGAWISTVVSGAMVVLGTISFFKQWSQVSAVAEYIAFTSVSFFLMAIGEGTKGVKLELGASFECLLNSEHMEQNRRSEEEVSV